MRTLDEIISIFKDNNVTGYQLQRDLDISQVGADKILNGESKRPRKSTLEMLNSYIDNNFKPLDNSYTTNNAIEESVVSEPDAIWVDYNSFKLVPLVMHRAQAGFLSGWGDDRYIDDLPKIPWEVDQEYKGNYMCFEVSGDSMDDNTSNSIIDGEILLCREVQKHHWINKLHVNKWFFVIVHRERGIVVKKIVKHNLQNGNLQLHSLNPLYDDYIVNLNDCIAIFNVIEKKKSMRQ